MALISSAPRMVITGRTPLLSLLSKALAAMSACSESVQSRVNKLMDVAHSSSVEFGSRHLSHSDELLANPAGSGNDAVGISFNATARNSQVSVGLASAGFSSALAADFSIRA